MTGNQIAEEGLAAIRKNFPKVQFDDQNPIIIKRDEEEEEVETTKKSSDEEE